MRIAPILVVVTLCYGAAACGGAADHGASSAEMAMLEAPSSTPQPTATSLRAQDQRAADSSPGIPQRLVRTATAAVDVADLPATVDRVRELVASVAGTIAQSEVHAGRDGASEAVLLLRVPAESLDSVLAGIQSLGVVRSISIASADVSREYFDTETRLAVMEETVQRLRQLITRATDVEGVIAVERELGRATAELESLKGQIRYFDQQIAQSDIRLRLYESAGGLRASAVRPVSTAFRSAVDVLAQSVAALVYIVVFLVPWLVVAGILWPVGRRVRRALRHKGARSAES